MKKILILTLFFILLTSMVNAVCTVNFDDTTYTTGQTITAEMVCSGSEEQNRAYTLTWSNGTTIQVDTGTTPSVAGTSFFETYSIPLGSGSQTITATLTGTNLEGSDSATVTESTGNTLTINDCKFKPKAFIGADFSVDCEIRNNATKLIDNAHCMVYATDNNDAPLQIAEFVSDSMNGRFVASGVLKPENMKEDISYLAKIKCYCESGDNKCWDEDGVAIENYQGSTSIAFETAQWLKVNTLVDMSEYEARQVALISANVTNVDGTGRIPMEIYYQVRCGDLNSDLDRAVISTNELNRPDKRGISFNTTQNQAWALMVPEKRWMQGKVNKCYASSEVWVVNEENKKIKGYFTTSPTFNITILDLGINPDWLISDDKKTVSTIVNLSSDKYNDYQGTFIGNVDLRLDMHTPETTDPYSDSSTDGIIIYDHLLDVQTIKSISVSNCSGESLEYNLEVTNDGFVEIEVKDVNQSTGCFEATVTINEDDNMEIALVMTFIIIFLGFIMLGFLNAEIKARFFCFAMAFIQLMILYGVIYGKYIGKDISGLLGMNFTILVILGFGIGMITMFIFTIKNLDWTGNDKEEKGKWGNDKWR